MQGAGLSAAVRGFTGDRFDFTMGERCATVSTTGEYHYRGRLVGATTTGGPRDLLAYRTKLLDQTSLVAS